METFSCKFKTYIDGDYSNNSYTFNRSNRSNINKYEIRSPPETINYKSIYRSIIRNVISGDQLDWHNINITKGDNKKLIISQPAPNRNSIPVAEKKHNIRETDYSDISSDSEDDNQNISNQQENPWEIISKLRWPDSDEQTASSLYILNRLSRGEILILKNFIYHHIDVLRRTFREYEILSQLSEIEKTDFLSHIVAKGKEFYDNIIEEPMLCLPWIENRLFQPFYTYLYRT